MPKSTRYNVRHIPHIPIPFTIWDNNIGSIICYSRSKTIADSIALAMNTLNDWEPINKVEQERILRNDINVDFKGNITG